MRPTSNSSPRPASRCHPDLRRAHPDEVVYACALYTDDGWMTVVPAANSEEGFQRAAGDGTDPAESAYARWATAEWVYEATGGEHFDAANALLNALDEAEEAEEAEVDRVEELPPPGEGEALLASMTEGLRLLDAEGFFGTGGERERVTLSITISDSDEAEEAQTSSARQPARGRGSLRRELMVLRPEHSPRATTAWPLVCNAPGLPFFQPRPPGSGSQATLRRASF